MRKPGDNKVYLVKGAIRSNIVKNPDEWRDRKVFVFSQDSCVSFTATFPDGKSGYTVAREDSQWVLTPEKGKKFKPDDGTLMGVMTGVLRISVGEFIVDSIQKQIDYSKVMAHFNFEMKNDPKTYGITFFQYPNNEQKVVFKVDGQNEPFTAWKATYDVIGKKAEEINSEFVKKRKAREAAGMKTAKEVVGKGLKKKAMEAARKKAAK